MNDGSAGLNCISVNGYGSTGSSAVVDLLKEVEGACVPRGEFRFLVDPDGLEDLLSNLQHSWDWNRTDAYIRRFIQYTNKLGRRGNWFTFGDNLQQLFNGKFYQLRDEFVESIVDCTWEGHWHYHDLYERGFLAAFFEKLKRYTRHFGASKRVIRSLTAKNKMYFVRHDVDYFHYARIFLVSLFGELAAVSSAKHLIFDHLVHPYNSINFRPMFDSLLQVIVDRDPRDVFLDARTYNAYPITEDIMTYISFYESMRTRKNYSDEKEIKKIQFEDLIYKYDEAVGEIFSFLGVGVEEHTQKNKYLKPELSIRNTKTWLRPENKKFKKDIDLIEKHLEKWCYKFPS